MGGERVVHKYNGILFSYKKECICVSSSEADELRACSVQFSSVAQSCPTLCDLMDCSMPGLPVHLQLLQFTQTHVHWVGDIAHKSAQSLGEERTLTLVGPLKDAVHILVHLIFTMNLGGKYMILLFYRWEKGVQRGWVIGKDRLFTTPQMLLNVIRDD